MTDTRPMIEMPAHVLRESLNRVKHAAGKDDSRPILQTVALDAADETVSLMAADNYRIAVLKIEGVEVTGQWPRTLIRTDSLPLILILLKDGKKLPVQIERVGDNRIRFTTWLASVEVGLMDGTYPNVAVVTDPVQAFPAIVTFNPAYIGDLGVGAAGSPLATVYVRDAVSPVMVRMGDDYTEYIMPVKTVPSDMPAAVAS